MKSDFTVFDTLNIEHKNSSSSAHAACVSSRTVAWVKLFASRLLACPVKVYTNQVKQPKTFTPQSELSTTLRRPDKRGLLDRIEYEGAEFVDVRPDS